MLEQTKTTPFVHFIDGQLVIKGNSFPIFSVIGYDQFLQSIRLYTENPPSKTIVKIDVDIINGFTKRYIMKAFRLLEKVKKPEKKVVIHWLYDEEDDDMLELGGIYQSLISLPFVFISKRTEQKKS